MDPDLARLTAMPGSHELSVSEVAHVLDVSEDTIQRAVNKGTLEAKRHTGRGHGKSPRIRIPRAAVVAYLVRITGGDRAILLAAIEAQCPQHLPAAKAALNPQSAITNPQSELPGNAIPFPSRRRPAAVAQRDTFDHPDLFGGVA